MYLIWSHEHNQWWGPAQRGYTPDKRLAGHYTRDQAADIVLDHVPSGEEVAIPVGIAMETGTKTVWGVKAAP